MLFTHVSHFLENFLKNYNTKKRWEGQYFDLWDTTAEILDEIVGQINGWSSSSVEGEYDIFWGQIEDSITRYWTSTTGNLESAVSTSLLFSASVELQETCKKQDFQNPSIPFWLKNQQRFAGEDEIETENAELQSTRCERTSYFHSKYKRNSVQKQRIITSQQSQQSSRNPQKMSR